MAKLFQSLTDKLGAVTERLSERERKMLTILVSVGVCLIVIAVFFGVSQRLDARRAEIEVAKKQLVEITSLQDVYRQAKAKQEAEEMRFRTNPISLFSFLQSVSTRLGLTLFDLNEHRTPIAGSRLVESDVVVTLKQISIDKLTAFLEAVEDSASGSVVKVKQLKVKARFDTPDLLDVQMTVATWKTS